jgi:cytochrome c-type biogenesis protein CcmH
VSSPENAGTRAKKKGKAEPFRKSRQFAGACAFAVICVPVLSIALYLAYGSPNLPGQPHAARIKSPPGHEQIVELVGKVEERLRTNPDDGAGWNVIAPVYMKFGRYQDAAAAYRQAIRLLGPDAKRLMGVGEAEALANNGIVNETSRQAFEAVLKIEPARHKARYWLAIAREQDGRFDDAAKAWQDLLARGKATALWRRQVEYCLEAAQARSKSGGGEGGRRPATCSEGGEPAEKAPVPVAKGPTQEQIAAAKEMPAEDRSAMINRMVSGLAERLREDGSDLEGWLKLVRAYTVLGKRDEALKAYADAQKNFAGNAEALGTLLALKKQLNL